MNKTPFFLKPLLLTLLATSLSTTVFGQLDTNRARAVNVGESTLVDCTVNSRIKRLNMEVSIDAPYANLSVLVNNKVLVDNIDIPSQGVHNLNTIVNFPTTGDIQLEFVSTLGNVTINNLQIEDVDNIVIPKYVEVTKEIGLLDDPSIKYGGPSIADINNDGNYDMILNNHNDVSSRLFMNNGDGTVSKAQDLSQFNRMDLHGSAAGDYDNDGDLDVVISLGGGNGTNPAPPVFYKNNGGKLIRSEAEVGITSGARGRSPKWVDFDLDGDLDLALFNAAGINGGSGAQHIFYSNKGDGTFNLVSVPGLENAKGDRVIVTDLNNDFIDDLLIVNPLSVWKGNGDFSFENTTDKWLPAAIRGRFENLAATDIDIDNDGDLDLYIAGGQDVFSVSNKNSVDFFPIRKILDARTTGSEGVLTFDLVAEEEITLSELDLLGRKGFAEDYPIFLGSNKSPNVLDGIDDTLSIKADEAAGWSDIRTENGIYIGYLGDNKWKFETVRNSDIFFNVSFTLTGINDFTSSVNLNNRNIPDILLRNDQNDKGEPVFVNVSDQWNIPKGGNHWGVTTGDFNNDSFQDLYVYRYGFLKNRRSDYMLLNNGNGKFEITTHHTANDLGANSHGDMGQAFDFDLDGDVDILNGDDEVGIWHMYRNEKKDNGNYAIVKVGYSPVSNVDPLSADVTITTANRSLRRRVGSAGSAFSQSLLNMIHFGLGTDETIENITVRWRNGETASFNNEAVNQIFDTNAVDPTSITIVPAPIEVRVGTKTQLELVIEPVFANRNVVWTSANEAIATVDQNGIVTGVLEGGETEITATSVGDTSVKTTVTVNVVTFFEIFAESIVLGVDTVNLVTGNTKLIQSKVLPKDADDVAIIWTSADATIATVSENGLITAVSDGKTTVMATLLSGGKTITQEVVVNVSRLIAPSIEFDDVNTYLNNEFFINDTLEVTIDYHAGTGNTVVASTNQGVRFFLRHLTSAFGVIKDVIVVDESAINTESGKSTVSIPLEGLIPSKELTNGEFYFLFVQYTNSKGEALNTSVHPIQIVEKETLSIGNINLLQTDKARMFPNPASKTISFAGVENLKYKVTISNLYGESVVRKEVVGTNEIPINALNKGFYIVTLETDNEKKVFSLIKQ